MTTSYTLIRLNKPSSSQQTRSSYNGNMNNTHFKLQSNHNINHQANHHQHIHEYLFEDQIIDLNDEVRQAESILDSNIYDINLIEPVIEQKYQIYRNINECLSALNL
eukprot:141098_1